MTLLFGLYGRLFGCRTAERDFLAVGHLLWSAVGIACRLETHHPAQAHRLFVDSRVNALYHLDIVGCSVFLYLETHHNRAFLCGVSRIAQVVVDEFLHIALEARSRSHSLFFRRHFGLLLRCFLHIFLILTAFQAREDNHCGNNQYRKNHSGGNHSAHRCLFPFRVSASRTRFCRRHYARGSLRLHRQRASHAVDTDKICRIVVVAVHTHRSYPGTFFSVGSRFAEDFDKHIVTKILQHAVGAHKHIIARTHIGDVDRCCSRTLLLCVGHTHRTRNHIAVGMRFRLLLRYHAGTHKGVDQRMVVGAVDNTAARAHIVHTAVADMGDETAA